jgi:hypothetical protein
LLPKKDVIDHMLQSYVDIDNQYVQAYNALKLKYNVTFPEPDKKSERATVFRRYGCDTNNKERFYDVSLLNINPSDAGFKNVLLNNIKLMHQWANSDLICQQNKELGIAAGINYFTSKEEYYHTIKKALSILFKEVNKVKDKNGLQVVRVTTIGSLSKMDDVFNGRPNFNSAWKKHPTYKKLMEYKTLIESSIESRGGGRTKRKKTRRKPRKRNKKTRSRR